MCLFSRLTHSKPSYLKKCLFLSIMWLLSVVLIYTTYCLSACSVTQKPSSLKPLVYMDFPVGVNHHQASGLRLLVGDTLR